MRKIAMTVLCEEPDTSLSPFFARARWIVLIDEPGGRRLLIRNPDSSARFVVDQIRRAQASVVLCGHIDCDSARELIDAGMDLRIGPCSVPAESLLDRIDDLPPYAMVGAPTAQA